MEDSFSIEGQSPSDLLQLAHRVIANAGIRCLSYELGNIVERGTFGQDVRTLHQAIHHPLAQVGLASDLVDERRGIAAGDGTLCHLRIRTQLVIESRKYLLGSHFHFGQNLWNRMALEPDRPLVLRGGHAIAAHQTVEEGRNRRCLSLIRRGQNADTTGSNVTDFGPDGQAGGIRHRDLVAVRGHIEVQTAVIPAQIADLVLAVEDSRNDLVDRRCRDEKSIRPVNADQGTIRNL